jgi:VanZ family protein
MHFIEYGFLAFITFLAFSGNNFRIPLKKVILITGSLILFAVADEFHQKLIPGRSFNIMDILSNITGITVISVITFVIFGYVRIRMKIH